MSQYLKMVRIQLLTIFGLSARKVLGSEGKMTVIFESFNQSVNVSQTIQALTVSVNCHVYDQLKRFLSFEGKINQSDVTKSY